MTSGLCLALGFAVLWWAIACGTGSVAGHGTDAGLDDGGGLPDGDPATGDDAGQATDEQADNPDEPVGSDTSQPGDADGDGLPDSFEQAAADSALLDPLKSDSDGDGTSDADEDYDNDGLTNREEYAAGRLTEMVGLGGPHPLRRDLLIELDWMQDRRPPDSALAGVIEAFADIPLQNPDGSYGVAVHFYADEQDLAAQDFDGTFEQRHAYFKAHGPGLQDGQQPPLPLNRMVHVVIAAKRLDILDRGGEVVTDANGDVEKTGVFLYLDVIRDLFPDCEIQGFPALTPDEMITTTLTHELGHILQLGHDTELNGGVNYHNVMSVPVSCTTAQMRVHGAQNDDPGLGATELVNAPRFSLDAAKLMRFGGKISVDTAVIQDMDGYEM